MWINHDAKLSDLWKVKLDSEGFKVIITSKETLVFTLSALFTTWSNKKSINNNITKEHWSNYNNCPVGIPQQQIYTSCGLVKFIKQVNETVDLADWS